VTNSRFIKQSHIEDLIHAETSSDSAEKSKPHPDIFDAALGELGDVLRSHVVVVGDTPYDAQAACKAQLQTIGMLSGGWQEEPPRSRLHRNLSGSRRPAREL